MLFNNGRSPDRHWSTVDEYELPYNPSFPLLPHLQAKTQEQPQTQQQMIEMTQCHLANR